MKTRLHYALGYLSTYSLLAFSLTELVNHITNVDIAYGLYWTVLTAWDIRLAVKWHDYVDRDKRSRTLSDDL